MKLKLLLLVFSFFFSFCKSQVSGYYVGCWYESRFEYKLFPNKTFWFRESGHIGHSRSSGYYEINNDTIILKSTKTDSLKDVFTNFENHKFVFDNKDCIIDYIDGLDYCKSNYESYGDTSFVYKGSKKRINTDFKRDEPYEVIKIKKMKNLAKPSKADSLVCGNWFLAEQDIRTMVKKGSVPNERKFIKEFPCTYRVIIIQKGRRYWLEIDTNNQIEIMGAHSELFLEYKK